MAAQDWVNKDFYKTLGMKKDASAADIKKAYRKLAQELHPDVNPENAKAESRFKSVSEAYAVLGNEAKRKEYDEVRAEYRGFSRPGSGGGPSAGNVNLGDIFNGSNLGDIFGGIFNRGGGTTTTSGSRRAARRGADVETDVTISFNDSLDGVTVPLRMTGEGVCPTCHGTGAKAGHTPRVCAGCEGTGQVMRNQGGFAIPEVCPQCHGRGLTVDDPCADCKGTGRALSSRVVQARIPAGVKDGQKVRIHGKGAPGEFGGPAGDLHVKVNVAPDPVFGRSGDNLSVKVPVTFPEAALGAEIVVQTPRGGTVKVKLAPGTANGRTLRVRGRGVRRRDGTNGDLLVTVEVDVPQQLSSAAMDALKAFDEAMGDYNPRA